MRETVTIQVGQCGNQIGNQFWSLLLQEHEKTADTDDALSSFFRFAPQKDGKTHAMKARALLIDMECGPLQETMRSPLGSLFDDTQFVMDVSGSGNNFAHGHYEYGPQYRPQFEEGLRRISEHCDSLQTFLVAHSLSGGTGSGVGTYVLEMLHDLYPEVYRFSACVFPSADNDVVTAPYNSVLATHELVEHAHCVFPLDNHALEEITRLESKPTSSSTASSSSAAASSSSSTKTKNAATGVKDRGFDGINEVAARMLCHLTSSSRFHGEMNVDMNEICTNLVPYQRLHFLMTSISPHRAVNGRSQQPAFNTGASSSSSNGQRQATKGAMQRAFADIVCTHGRLTAADMTDSRSLTLAAAFLARGHIGPLSDFLGCVTAAQSNLRFPVWNPDACKIGVCGQPPLGRPMSVMGIFNNTSFASVLSREYNKFNMLYRHKAMLHHYTEFVDVGAIQEAAVNCYELLGEYADMETGARYRHKSLPPQAEEEQLFPAF